MALLAAGGLKSFGALEPRESSASGCVLQPLGAEVHDKVCRLFVGESSYPSRAPGTTQRDNHSLALYSKKGNETNMCARRLSRWMSFAS